MKCTHSGHAHPLSWLLLAKSTLHHTCKKMAAAHLQTPQSVISFQRCHREKNACDLTSLSVIQCGFCFSIWESWVLPCSLLCVAEFTHSSPGPMLPQSTTASLRTLEYNSAAGQGSRREEIRKRVIDTCTNTHTSWEIWWFSSVHPGPVSNLIIVRVFFVTGVDVASLSESAFAQEQEIWLFTFCGPDLNFLEPFKQDILDSCYSKWHVTERICARQS